MRTNIHRGALVCLMATAVLAAPSGTYDTVDHRKVGNCRVWSQVDMLSDQMSHHVECKQVRLGSAPLLQWAEVAVSLWHDARYQVSLGTGLQVHTDRGIKATWRFDKGEASTDILPWSSERHVAYKDLTDKEARDFLDRLAAANRLVLLVGKQGGNILLDGSADAVADFTARTGQGLPLPLGTDVTSR